MNELLELQAEDPAVALLMGSYAELEQIYRGSLEAMGVSQSTTIDVSNSAGVVVSFSHSDSTSQQ